MKLTLKFSIALIFIPMFSFASIDDYSWSLNKNSYLVEEQGETILMMADVTQYESKVSFIKELDFDEGVIEFELMSSEINSKMHNYPGLVFNVKDKLHWEVLYLRYRMDSMEGIQYLNSSNGKTNFQNFKGDDYFQYTPVMQHHGKWRKIKIVLTNDILEVYLDGNTTAEFITKRIKSDITSGSIGFYAYKSSNVTKYRNLVITPKN
ncbi:MAG: DUF1080 domain-containing protein [Saccharospirillaceae bacterium]|nr:DUF1080 domain-containing protein [Pseudomonadales bacterium]NRB80507.1 DUF1080 domain-containing protein [Saccharospirillaceae bacterium]